MSSASTASLTTLDAPGKGSTTHERGLGGGLRGKGEDEALSKRLDDINQKLAHVVAERKKLSPLKPHQGGKASKGKNSATADQQQGHLRRNKKKINHPNFDVILTEISLSPYLTNPEKNYSKKTIKLPSLIRDLRDRDLQASLSSTTSTTSLIGEKELNQLKKTFHEVMHYKQQFDTPLPTASHQAKGMKRRLPSIAKTENTLESLSGSQPISSSS
jgi:hypothetical protein